MAAYTQLKPSTRSAGTLKAAIGIALATWSTGHIAAQQSDRDIDEVHIIGQQNDTYKTNSMSSPQFTASLLDTAKTIHVITSDIMQDQGTDSLSDILNNVPGISMQAGEGGTPAGDQLSIRGFSARTDIFVDGARDFGGYARDSYNLEQVEVAKGPGSSYTGRGSTGGSINLVSKAARAGNFIDGNASFGNADYKRATLDANRKLTDTVAVRLNLLAHDANVVGRDIAENSRYGIAPSIAFGLGTDTTWILGYSRLQQDNVPDYGIPWVPATTTNPDLIPYINRIAPVDNSNWYGLKERDYEKIKNDLVTGKVEHALAENIVVSNQLRWGNTDRDSLITAPRFTTNTNSSDIRRTDWKSRDQEDRIINNLTALTMDFETGSVQHAFATGLELSDETEVNYTRTDTGAQPNTSLYAPNAEDVWGGTLVRTGAKVGSDGLSTGVYLADTMTLNEHWLVTAGLRWDRFRLVYTTTSAAGVDTEYSRTDKELSYQGSLVYKPVDYGSVYAGYGTSFNPSGEGLTLTTTSLAAIDPEQSKTMELGTKWELLDQHLFLNAALFRTAKTNARETDPVVSTLTVLSGEQVVKGVELGMVGRLTEAWNVIAGYTFMDGEITESVNQALPGNTLANTPEHTFNFWTTWRVIPALELGAGTQFIDDRYSASNNDRVAPHYQLYNAMVSWVLNPGLSFRLNATNLADKDYLASVGGGHSIPGEGRSVILSVNFSL